MTNSGGLRLRFLGALVEQLGAQLYPGTTATIAELISNAWDADARNVWVEIPLGRQWTDTDTIVVTDDGSGMSYDDAADCYLMVGRKQRIERGSELTDLGRPLHGRKGIGKLAAFGTAKILECYTVRAGSEPTSFRLDYDHIRALEATADYYVEVAHGGGPLLVPDGEPLEHGTRITLDSLKPRRAVNEAQFRQSLSRRFAIDANEMRIHVNGKVIDRFEYPLQFRFPSSGPLFDDVFVGADEWGEMELPGDRQRTVWAPRALVDWLHREAHQGEGITRRISARAQEDGAAPLPLSADGRCRRSARSRVPRWRGGGGLVGCRRRYRQ